MRGRRRPRLVRTGYLGGLAVRSALCALPLKQLREPAQTDQQLALFATRLRLTRVMVDLANEVEPGCAEPTDLAR